MLSKSLILLIFISLPACQKLSNAISPLRLDCGQDVAWQGSFLRFRDTVGRDLMADQFEVIALESQSRKDLQLSSRGCLALSTKGLWLIRSREKPEGLVVDTGNFHESTALQLQDTSDEKLKPSCPVYETGQSLDLTSVFPPSGNHDFRGYEITYTLNADAVQRTWPTENFSRLQKLELANFFPEGVFKLSLTTTNHFHRDEATDLSCSIRFDATGPMITPSFAEAVPKVYKGRPFLALSSEDDVHFTSKAEDFVAFDVCYEPRADWNAGTDIGPMTDLCAKPERVAGSRPVPVNERSGFWQLRYRGVDPAGNTSAWSDPSILLFEHTNVQQRLLSRAAAQQAELDTRFVAGTPNAMLIGLEMYQSWRNLPTAYERERLEASVLLALHRPWFSPGVQQVMHVLPELNIPRLAFPVMNGKKLVFAESPPPSEANASGLRIVLQNAETYAEEKQLPSTRTAPERWGVSADGLRFFYHDATILFYVNLGDTISISMFTAGPGGFIISARFLQKDQEFVIVSNDNKKLMEHRFEAGEKLKRHDPDTSRSKTLVGDQIQRYLQLDAEGQGFWVEDYQRGGLGYSPLFTDNEARTSKFDPLFIPNFAQGRDTVRVLERDTRFFITLPYADHPYCKAYFFDAELPGTPQARRFLDAMPCRASDQGTPLGDSVWMEGDENLGAVVYKPGAASLQKSASDMVESPKTFSQAYDTAFSPDGTWMFSGMLGEAADINGQRIGLLNVWHRDEQGTYVLFRQWNACGSDQPFGFQYDAVRRLLVHGCRQAEGSFYVWNLATAESKIGSTGESTGALALIGDQLLLSDMGGMVRVFHIDDQGNITARPSLKMGTQGIVKMIYAADEQRLYTIEAKGQTAVKVWDTQDLSQPLRTMPAQSRPSDRGSLSSDRQFLAMSSLADYPHVLVADVKNPGSRLDFADHKAPIMDVSFLGDSSLMVSGSLDGELRIRDVKNPDMPALAFHPELTILPIHSLGAVPGRNEFTVITTQGRMMQYKLESMDIMLQRSCENLRALLHFKAGMYPEQRTLCRPFEK